MAVEAWVIGGLPAEREERRRQREEKDLAHRRNLDHMLSLAKKKPITRHVDGFNNSLPEVEEDEEDAASRRAAREAQQAKEAEEKMSEREMYDRALSAVERKKRELLQRRAQVDASEAIASAAAATATEAAAEEDEEDEDEEDEENDEEDDDEEVPITRSSTKPYQEVQAAAAAGAAAEDEEPAAPPLQDASGFVQTYIAAAAFEGAKEGYVFMSGARGLGYYRDGATGSATKHARSETKVVEVDADLDELD